MSFGVRVVVTCDFRDCEEKFEAAMHGSVWRAKDLRQQAPPGWYLPGPGEPVYVGEYYCPAHRVDILGAAAIPPVEKAA